MSTLLLDIYIYINGNIVNEYIAIGYIGNEYIATELFI